MKPFPFLPIAIGLWLAGANSALASPLLTFATQAQGQAALGTRDEFVARLSPFDRAARLKTRKVVSEQEYLAFVRASVMGWNDATEKRRVADAAEIVEKDFSALGLSVPDAQLVRTNGNEEGNTAYTRGHVVVIPPGILNDPKQDLVQVISHELFHVISRNDPALRDKLYRAIGFEPCAEYVFPSALAARRITDPDAPRNDHCIRLKYRGRSVWATPILYADRDRYDLRKGGLFFDYLQFSLALSDGSGSPTAPPPKSGNAGTRLVDPKEVTGFYEQVGKNTDYIIHPEEILADNFALMVMKKSDLPSPAIPAAMLRIFREAQKNP